MAKKKEAEESEELDSAEVEELRQEAKLARDAGDAQAAWEDKRRRTLVSDLGEVRGMRIFEREKEGEFKHLWPHPDVGK